MADNAPSYFNEGTATVGAGGTTVTLAGYGNFFNVVRVGDYFGAHVGMPTRIAALDPDNDQIELAYPWAGPAQTAAPYEVQFTPYYVQYRQQVAMLLAMLQSGNVEALSELEGLPDRLPMFTGPGAMGLIDKADITAGTMAASVYDPNEIEADVFSMGNMVETSTAKVFTDDERDKLAALDLDADETNAATVGAAVAGVSGKTTPADADMFAGVLSGSSDLFWSTWANIKSTLKTYFDALYAPASIADVAAGALQRAGDTMTGTLVLADDPVNDLEAATKQYVDSSGIEIYDDTNNAEVDFPVGHVIAIYTASTQTARNGVIAPRLHSTQTNEYVLGGAGAALNGVWHSRGKTSSEFTIAQRVA